MLMHMPFSALYCLIKHTHLKEQAAKSGKLIKVLFHVCMNLDGTEFHFYLQENQTGMISKHMVSAMHFVSLYGCLDEEIFGEFPVSLGRSII
jgi:hypothetical protein